MMLNAIESAQRWMERKVILAYAIIAAILLATALALSAVRTGGWEEKLFSVLPECSTSKAAEVNKKKIRDALETFPGTLAKIGIALLGVSVLARTTRKLEPSAPEREGEAPAEPCPISDRREPHPPVLLDWIAPAILAAVVLVQVAPSMNRPLVGDELENYQKHLTLPFKRVLTTMEGANNQLGFTLLSWTSMRIFGDSPACVRLPALLGGMLLPAVAYLLGRRTFGRAGALALGAALALWPDCTLAAMQGRSYSLLMLVSVIHVYYFRRFVTSADRTSGLIYAATLAAACTLHLWFVLVVGAELLFLSLRRLPVFGGKSPLAVETFLVALTLGGLGAAVIQAGILPKFLYVLTQKNPTPVDARRVLSSIGECHLGYSFDNDQVDAYYRVSWTNDVLRTGIDLLAFVGVVACCWSARKNEAARFQIGSYLVVAATFFLIVYIQKPVYIYSRFFVYLPISLFWAAAYGWGDLLSRQTVAAPSERAAFVPGLKRRPKGEASARISPHG
jgi:hypothetical protein